MRSTSRLFLVLAAGWPLSVRAQCPPSWGGMFPGGEPNGTVRASVVFDDGTGPALYIAGDFALAGPTPASFVARWNGQRWLPVGANNTSWASGDYGSALAVFDDDGPGPHPPALYLGIGTAGSQAGVYKWNGLTWSSLPLDVRNNINALTVFDDGSGPALYAAGSFTGPTSSRGIAKWNGTAWSGLSTGVAGNTSTVYALAVFDEDGAGPLPPSLVVGGDFTSAGGASSVYISRWRSGAWSSLGPGAGFQTRALTVFDDGSGAALYAGGFINLAGAEHVRRWNGTLWSTPTPGLTNANDTVYTLAAFDPDGAGPLPTTLFAGGHLLSSDNSTYTAVRRWTGSAWADTGGIFDQALTLCAFDPDAAGPQIPQLFAGGSMTLASTGIPGANFMRYNGTTWEAPDPGRGFNYNAACIAALDPDGPGPQPQRLYVGGYITLAGGQPCTGVVSYDGQSWSSLPAVSGGLLPLPYSMTVYDDGSGPALYIGGGFTTAGNTTVNGVAKWSGTQWLPLGSGIGGTGFLIPYAMCVFDEDGPGPNPPSLFVAGDFTTAGGITVNRIARWDGQSWSALQGGANNEIHALIVHDDGSGPALYAGGNFSLMNGSSMHQVARWNGSAWSPLASGPGGGVNALAVFDDDGPGPNPPSLIAAGVIAPSPLLRGTIMKWNGTAWSALATMGSSSQPEVRSLLVLDDDGPGPNPTSLFIGGLNMNCAGATRIARWANGSFFTLNAGSGGGYDLSTGFSASTSAVQAMAAFDDGLTPGTPALFAVGTFSTACTGGLQQPPIASSRIARWGVTPGPAIVAPPASAAAAPGSVVTFTVSAAGVWPFTYQWRHGGAPLANGGSISGALSSALTINPVAAADAGAYDVVITTGCGQVTSAPALLTIPGSCYANCDGSTTPPVLNVLDFTCFLNKFAALDPYANCDHSTTPPTLNVLDFTCFLNSFAAGCP